jgi:hypothetical protein
MHGLRKEVTKKSDETQVNLQTIRMSIDTWTQSLLETFTDTRDQLHKELQVETQTMKALTEATRHEFQAQLKEVYIWAKHGRATGTGASVAMPPKFDRITSWAVFWCQFENIAEHNCCTCQDNSTYLITVLQGRATNVLHGVTKGATCEETLEALEDRFGDQHLAAAYHSKQKPRIQGVEESLEKFSTAIKQLTHHAYPTLSEDHIRREAGKAFAEGVEDPAIKNQLLLGGEKTVIEALRRALEMQAVFIATRPHKTSARIFCGIRSSPTQRRETRQSACRSCGEPGHFQGSCT